MSKANDLQGFCYFTAVHLFYRRGIRGSAQQGTEGNIRPLRDDTHLRPELELDFALAPWPLPPNGAHEGTFSGTGLAHYEDTFAMGDRHIRVVHHQPGIVERHR